jgi:hypothetical protein
VGQAQEPLAAYRFNAEPYLPATTNAAGLTASPVSLSSGSFATGEVNVVTGTYFPDEPYIEESAGWTASSPTNAKAFLLTLTPDAGKSITVTGLSFKAYAVGTTGPSAISYDVAGLATGTINATNDLVLTNDFAIAGVTNQAGAVLIKIQGWTNNTRAVSGGGAFRLDDVLVYGVVEAIPTNLQFAGSSATMRESSSYTVTVTKTVSSGSVSAELQLGGTATPGADYTVDTTNVVLDGATTSATVVVTAADDASLEGPESLTLTLANVVFFSFS